MNEWVLAIELCALVLVDEIVGAICMNEWCLTHVRD